MKQTKVISVNAFARRFGLTRSAVIDRIRAGTLASQYDTRTKHYSIPTAEVERMRNEIFAGARELETQRANLTSISHWMDDQISKAAMSVQKAKADLKSQTAGTKAHRDAQEALDKAFATFDAEDDLQKSYLVLAKRIERAGAEFLAQFNEGNTADDEAGRANA